MQDTEFRVFTALEDYDSKLLTVWDYSVLYNIHPHQIRANVNTKEEMTNLSLKYKLLADRNK